MKTLWDFMEYLGELQVLEEKQELLDEMLFSKRVLELGEVGVQLCLEPQSTLPGMQGGTHSQVAHQAQELSPRLDLVRHKVNHRLLTVLVS